MENQVIQDDNFSLTGVTSGSIKSAMKNAGATSRDLWYVPPAEINQLDDFNVRVKNEDYSASVRMLADSIKANGFYAHKPIACMVIKRNGSDVLAIIDGHTRYDAAMLAISEGAQIDKLPVVTTQSGTSLEDAIAGLVTNNNGKPLAPMALGIVCKRLVSFGWTNSKVAQKLAMTPAYVGQLLQLVSADKAIRDLVNEDKISATLAVQTINQEGEKAKEVLQEAVKTAEKAGKTRATSKHVKPFKPAVVPMVDVAPVAPVAQNAVTPFDALVTACTTPTDDLIAKAQAWLEKNQGIADSSHTDLILALLGVDLSGMLASE